MEPVFRATSATSFSAALRLLNARRRLRRLAPMQAFGPFELDRAGRRVWRDGRVLPLRERAVEVLLALLERPGEVVDKRALFERAWPELDDAENNLQVEISALRRQLGPGLIVTVPGRGYQLALPAPRIAALLGRDDDLATLRSALAAGGLVTLTGEGGIGKSALAAAWAAATPGVLHVALDGIDDEEAAVCQALAAALRLPAGAGVAAASATLAGTGAVWLDDADGAVAALAAVLDRLLQGRPRLPVLVTTRETLGLPTEQVLRLRGLSLEAGCAVLRHELGAALAGEIGEAPLVALCHRVEGHPLALAWWVEQLRSGGAARLAAMHGPTADARFEAAAPHPPRHHHLCAAVAGSAGRLSPELRELWQALATLPDPFTFDDLPPTLGSEAQRADGLTALVGRSLVEVLAAERPAQPPRHRLSALVRLYLSGNAAG
jgi:DNA-binding winged helix-turn-helix (wHTH) protein